ncbi:MAG: zinc transporter ZupT [Phycisphaerales bacterium]|jgi:zinc transporter, ZIP family|nr:zinc transporter ZupT [Phycisphaerales bacterium]
MDSHTVWMAFGLTLLAGLSTGIGSAMAFFAHHTNHRFLSISTGFSAGVMLYVSFVEIFPKARETLMESMGTAGAQWATVGAFFGGMVLIGLIDKLIPSAENPHEVRHDSDLDELHQDDPHPKETHTEERRRKHRLHRMGIMTALAIGIHNFPEGMATFIAALEDPQLGIAIAIAIALHNIPEGISVAVPIYHATGSRKRAFFWSFLSGLAEPVGAGVGYFLLRPWLTPNLMGMLFASVAGVMVFISLDELLPASREYSKGHDSIYGLMAGMAVMALSLLLLT